MIGKVSGEGFNEQDYRRELMDISIEATDGLVTVLENGQKFPFAFGDVLVRGSEDGAVVVELIPDVATGSDKEECLKDLVYRATLRGEYQFTELNEEKSGVPYHGN